MIARMVCALLAHFGNIKKTDKKNSERPVDALAENGKLPTHLVTTSNQEMLAHLKMHQPTIRGDTSHVQR